MDKISQVEIVTNMSKLKQITIRFNVLKTYTLPKYPERDWQFFLYPYHNFVRSAWKFSCFAKTFDWWIFLGRTTWPEVERLEIKTKIYITLSNDVSRQRVLLPVRLSWRAFGTLLLAFVGNVSPTMPQSAAEMLACATHCTLRPANLPEYPWSLTAGQLRSPFHRPAIEERRGVKTVFDYFNNDVRHRREVLCERQFTVIWNIQNVRTRAVVDDVLPRRNRNSNVLGRPRESINYAQLICFNFRQQHWRKNWQQEVLAPTYPRIL